MRKEPLKSIKLYEHPKVVDLFTRANWISFFNRIQGYDEEVTEEFLMSLRPHSKTHATVGFRGLTRKENAQVGRKKQSITKTEDN